MAGLYVQHKLPLNETWKKGTYFKLLAHKGGDVNLFIFLPQTLIRLLQIGFIL